MNKLSRLYDKNMPLVSVIVPIYNAEKYLDKCIQSIVKQTYKNLQIVLVDDGSEDGSSLLCDKYSKMDDRVEVIRKSNGGIVSARKSGIRAAKGEFICWVDADDWIDKNYIECLVSLQRESESDIVAVSHYHEVAGDVSLIKDGIVSGNYRLDDVIGNMLYIGKFYEYGIGPHLWTKLFRAAVIKPIQLAVPDEIVAGDDAAVVYPSLLRAKKICVSDIAGYHYVQNSGSITKVRRSDEFERVQVLVEYLQKIFEQEGVMDVMKSQLCVYRKYLLALRDIGIFDGGGKALRPFGGIRKGERVVIYGAGVLGQQLRDYLIQNGIFVVDWLDREFKFYQKGGFDVHDPDSFSCIDSDYEYVLIANIKQDTAMSIKTYLVSKGVFEDKILWFTEEFRRVEE